MSSANQPVTIDPSELQDARSAIVSAGFNPDQFFFSGRNVPTKEKQYPVAYYVAVERDGCIRRVYEGGNGRAWSADFETQLRAGVFGRPRRELISEADLLLWIATHAQQLAGTQATSASYAISYRLVGRDTRGTDLNWAIATPVGGHGNEVPEHVSQAIVAAMARFRVDWPAKG